MFKNKWLIAVITLIMAAAVLFVFFRIRGGSMEVKVAEARKGNILSMISASGLVEANSVELGSAKMAGRVEWVGVNEGDRVKKGEILIKLDGYEQARKEYFRLSKLHSEGYVSDLELERARAAMENGRIEAPFSGIVAEKSVDPGEGISPGMPVMTIVDIDHPWVEIQIDEVDIAVVKVGQKVRFTTDAFPEQEYFGEIIWINKKAELKKVGGRVRMDEESMIFRAKVSFLDGKSILRPGMTVYAEIITGEKKDALTVPREAIALRNGKRIVFAVKEGRARQKEVELGIKDAEKVEILSGLSVGETIAVSNLDKLKNNEKVQVSVK